MADYGDRILRNRRPLPYKKYFDKDFEQLSSQPIVDTASVMTKVPIILSKPSKPIAVYNSNSVTLGSEDSGDAPPDRQNTATSRPADKAPTVMLKARNVDGVRNTSNHVTQSIPGMLAGDSFSQPQLHQLHSTIQTPSSTGSSSSSAAHTATATHSVKMIDEAFVWSDAGLDMLLDQHDFLVVGVLGTQSVGKSTVMSALAGGDHAKMHMFDVGDTKLLDGIHQTNGIDVYVTGERTILLDSQPLLSASVLDNLIHQDKKSSVPMTTSPMDHAGLDNSAELQSLQIASFMMTVCNVIIVVIDWFIDLSLVRFLQLAEMMKPSTPGTGAQSGPNGIVSGSDETLDYFPHIAFVLNHAEMTHFRPEYISYMQKSLRRLMNQSKLKITGLMSSVSAARDPRAVRVTEDRVNLFLLPSMTLSDAADGSVHKSGGMEAVLSGYSGHQDFTKHVKDLTHSLLAMPRHALTQHNLSERTWFHYAARSWDVVRKSQLLAEYSRLQS